MLQAVIFDFDGVITDSEPLHYHALLATLNDRGIQFDWQTYCEKYLAYDDRDLFRHVLADAGRDPAPDLIARLMETKNAQILHAIPQHTDLLPGVAALIDDLAHHNVPAAICSGARRNEVELFLQLAGLDHYFRFLVAADDVAHAKPDPQGYRLALEKLIPYFPEPPIATRCVAIEDSPGGLRAAHDAGLTTLAVAHGYPTGSAAPLAAKTVVEDLSAVDTSFLARLVEQTAV